MATLADITERFRTAVGGGDPLGCSLKFELKGAGVVVIDPREGDASEGGVDNRDRPADLTIRVAQADLEALEAGRLDPVSAVMSGRLRMSDMALAMRVQPQLQALFGRLRRS